MIFGTTVVRDTFGFNYGSVNYYNLIGQYWFTDDTVNQLIAYLTIISVIVVNILVIRIYIGKKEKAIDLYEKQST